MGSPATPTKDQVAQLVRAARMEVRTVRVERNAHDDGVTLRTRLPLQGVELLELGP